MKKYIFSVAFTSLFIFMTSGWADLTPGDRRELKDTYKIILQKKKGPFTINYCTCVNGKLAPVADKNLRVRPDPCGEIEDVGQLFCSAYRNDLAKKLARHGLYVANIFSNEVFLWEKHKDHHRLAKGFILEKHYMETHPESKLTTSRAYGGISGAEFEVKYAPIFFGKYYGLPDWNDFRDYLVQYELQRRFFVRGNRSLIHDIRNLASSIYRSYAPFKPVKDLVHNRMSAGLIPMIEEFHKKHPADKKNAEKYAELVRMIRQLTHVDKSDLKEYLPKISDRKLRKRIETTVRLDKKLPLTLLTNLGELVAMSRHAIGKKEIDPKEAVELVNLNVSANLLMHVTVSRLMDLARTWTVKELLGVQRDVIAGVYGAGLISHREFEAAKTLLTELLNQKDLTVGEMYRGLNRANRVVEWAQASIEAAFWDVWEPWTYLFPDVQSVTDDIIRSSPLLHYASLVKSLRGHLLGKLNLEHHVLGKTTTEGVRALNPGLALGPIKFFSDDVGYTRDDILALETTNAELEPVAGIITKDEGNVVSHVQLLARALGVPNTVFLDALYSRLERVKGKPLFYAATPMGRVILKEAEKMNATDKLILSEYEKREKRASDGDVRGHSSKLTIDADRLNLQKTRLLPLEKVRRKDSGVICGPKAAFLGELKHHFPDNVARGVVIPFGVYNNHFIKAKVAVPKELGEKDLAQPGKALPAFVRRTYDTFFNELLVDPKVSSAQLEEWIRPRLDVIRYSIREISLDPAFVASLEKELANQGLFLDKKHEAMHGVFIRSDTNVEDMPNFNGAGLNLTIFNLRKFSDVLDGIKEVWASPFTYRSFSWRQSVISDPNLVFPSIVVLESIPSDKSGVLITADVDTGDPSHMTIATAEGVGGTVDGSPAETLLYGADKVVLLSQFKAPKRRMLVLTGRGGAEMVPSTGSEYVLSEKELEALVAAAAKIKQEFAPEKGPEGEPLPWDIEYGFAKGLLYLFQTRPFVGNSDLRNLPALADLDKGIKEKEGEPFSLEEKVKWQQ